MAKHFTSLSDPELIKLIASGAIGVIPTDTVYGLVAKAGSREAVASLYNVKKRELPPGTMIGASIKDFVEIGFKEKQLAEVKKYWPASISVVLDAHNVASYIKQSRSDLPVRIPSVPLLAQLLSVTGPLMTTSANAPKEPTSTTIQMAMDYFGDDVDFYVDGGDLSGRPPSTIIGFNDLGEIIVYRQGAVIL